MTTSIKEIDGKLVVTLSGELDTAAAPAVETALQPLSQCGGKDIIIECKELEYIASSGLRLLLGVLKKAKATGSHVVLKSVNEVVRDVLELTGFVSLFDIE